jgi:hypothetical protein
MIKASLKKLQNAYHSYRLSGEVAPLLKEILEDIPPINDSAIHSPTSRLRPISVDDLHLVCWEYIWS